MKIHQLLVFSLLIAAACRKTTGDIVYDDTGAEAELASRLPDCEVDPCVSWTLDGYASSLAPDEAGGAWMVVSRKAGDYEIGGCSQVDPSPSIYYNSGWLLHLDADGACQHLEALGHANGRIWRTPDGTLLLQGEYFPDMQVGEHRFVTSPGVAGHFRALRSPAGGWVVAESRREGGLAALDSVAPAGEGRLLGVGSANAGDRLLGAVPPEAGDFLYDIGVGIDSDDTTPSVDFQAIEYARPLGVWRTERGGTQLLAGAQGGTSTTAVVARLDGEAPWAAAVTAGGYNSFAAHGVPLTDGSFVAAFGMVSPFTPMPTEAHIGLIGGERYPFGFAWMGAVIAGVDADGAWAWSYPLTETVVWGLFQHGGRAWLVSGGTDVPRQRCRVGASGLDECIPWNQYFVTVDSAGHLWSLGGDGYASTGAVTRAGPSR